MEQQRRIHVFIARIASIAALLAAVAAWAQVPPPVDIPVANLTQGTPVWCWAAVAQQIINWSVGPAQTPQQCALVAVAYGAPPEVCCSGNPVCMQTGSMQQIQYLMARFGQHFSAIAPPTDPYTLYQTLAAGHPVILQVASGYASSHVVVVRGMAFVPSANGLVPVLNVNDPMSYFTQPVPFQALMGIWMNAIVVY